MKKEEFIMLRDFIYEKTGIFFTEEKIYLLKTRLFNRLAELGFNSYEDYCFFLKYGGKNSDNELLNLFNTITTNETFFFRNPPQLDAFKHIIKMTSSNGRMFPLRIWSAACSTGEEPYTITIILLELMEELKKMIPFIIYATDISTKALDSAKKALYGDYSMRNVEPDLRKKYFIQNGAHYELKPEVKNFVKIEFSNLANYSDYLKFRNMDIIFCRNVLIYFDDTIKKKVIENLYASLNTNGYLIIGHAEVLHNISIAFKPILFPNAIVYQKGGR